MSPFILAPRGLTRALRVVQHLPLLLHSFQDGTSLLVDLGLAMMFQRYFFLLAAVIAGGAVLYSFLQPNEAAPWLSGPKGKDKTVLFLSNYEYGLANSLLATAHSLLVHHPDIKVHFASFPKREKDTTSISNFAVQQNPKTSPIVFHKFNGPCYGDVLQASGHFIEETIHAPGVAGGAQLCRDMQKYLMPWNGSDYFGLYEEALKIIDEVDPALVALDPQFGPGLDATKDRKRRHAVVSPNSLRDSFAQMQPYGGEYPHVQTPICRLGSSLKIEMLIKTYQPCSGSTLRWVLAILILCRGPRYQQTSL